MNIYKMQDGRTQRMLCLSAVLVAVLTLPARATSFSEPHTVFYGKVLGTASAQPFLIQEGELRWTIRRADGASVTLGTTLYAYHDQQFSYRLNVPHSAIALGLEPAPGGIPLPPLPSALVHAQVTVDGQSAALLGPAGGAFTIEQLLRTSTYRLDLGVDRAPLDTDGDGIPDWWEDLYGLDKQDPADAALDFSGDHISALDAYQRGLDPNHDANIPVLLTDELIVYPSGATAILLDAADLDSAPEQLIYTLTGLDLAGTLTRRNANADPSQPDRVLAVHDTFTQSDLLQGRVIYQHDGSLAMPGRFSVSLRDEHAEHPATVGHVRLLAFQPADALPDILPVLEARRRLNFELAANGYIILDASGLPSDTLIATPSAGLSADALDDYRAAYGDDRSYVFLGGGEDGSLTGGHESDVLVATVNAGALTGGKGADWFLFESFGSGRVTITDFNPADGDILDFSRLSAAPGSLVHHYMRFAEVNGRLELQLARDGSGTGYTNLTVVLPGLSTEDADLYAMIGAGHLITGGLQLEPRLVVTASEPRASQSGPNAGRFTVQREGSLAQALSVNLSLSGTAVNGSDYAQMATTITLPAGVGSHDIAIMPHVTGYQGPPKVVHLNIMPGTGYRVGTQPGATVTIENLMMVVELDVIDAVGVMDAGTPAVIRLRRRHVTAGDALVRLAFGGTARAGTEYSPPGTLVNMAPGQTTTLLNVIPKTVENWSGGARSVTVTVLPDEDYLVKAGAGIVQVALIGRLDTFAGWRVREFDGQGGDLSAFAQADPGKRGATYLERYAFGLDPHRPDRRGLPRPLTRDGRLVVTFRRPLDVQGSVAYHVRGFTDLTRQAATAIPMHPIPAPDGTNDPEQVYYQAEATEATAVFAIVEVELLP